LKSGACIVVKIGGSLAEDPALARWLSALAGGGAVIVPGGGPYAELVRASQVRWHFSDETAHRMALLGMQQYGMLMCGLEPTLVASMNRDEIAAALRAGRSAVWLPDHRLGEADGLSYGWDVTSDSLAAWLAAQLEADCLVLVKSCDLPAARDDVVKLVEIGVVDKAFRDYASEGRFRVLALQKGEVGRLSLAFDRVDAE
jgi:aspartokinase-like uncharacterized kinase